MLRVSDVVDFQDPGTGDFEESGLDGSVDRASLVVPGRTEYVAAVRLTAAGLAARCDLTLDDIEDLRLAVDEACNLVLAAAGSAAPLTSPPLGAHFELTPGLISVEVSVPVETEIDRRGLSWVVLAELADSVAVVGGAGASGVAFCKRRDIARPR